MKYETTPAFDGDVRRLKRSGEYETFLEVVRDKFIPAAEQRRASPGDPWPKGIRLKSVQGAPGVLEMSWEIRDGRATFEWVEIEGESGIRWRRVGDHSLFSDP